MIVNLLVLYSLEDLFNHTLKEMKRQEEGREQENEV